MRLLGHFQIIIIKADKAEAQSHQQNHPDIGAAPREKVEVAPQQCGDKQAGENHQPAHGGRAALGQVGLRPVAADRLALALFDAQGRNGARAKKEHEKQGGRNRPACPEGQVAEQVERAKNIVKFIKPCQHVCS